MKRKIIIFLAVVLLTTAFLIGCEKESGEDSTPSAEPTQASQLQSNKPQGTPQINDEVAVGLVYTGEDYETQIIKQSVESLLAVSSIKIKVDVLQADAQEPGTAISQLVQGGSEIIFICGPDRQKILEAAALYPNVYFEIYNGTNAAAAPNVGVFFIKLYQQQYLNGMIAGFISETGCIGYMAESAQSTDIRRVNAFALGAKAANPEAQVHFAWAGESAEDGFINETADSLSGESCDVIFEMDIDEELYLFAQQNNVTLMGNAREGYENILPIIKPDATAYILSKARSVALGTYSPDDEISGWAGISEGYAPSLDKYPDLTSEQAAAISEAAQEMALGQWDVFTGPISDVYGQTILPEGVNLPDEDLLQMLWYVGNIKALPPPMG